MLIPVTPVITQVPAEDGAGAPVGPVTVAVNVIDDPSEEVAALAITETVGVDLLTVVVYPEVRADAR